MRQHIGNRYIEVFKAAAVDFIQVNAGNLPQVERFLSQGSHAMVRMRGLPFSATKLDVLDFLEGINIVNESDGIFLIKVKFKSSTLKQIYEEMNLLYLCI